MRKKIVFVISNIDKALGFEWMASSINSREFDTSYILLNPGESNFESWLRHHDFEVTRIRYRGKMDVFRAIIEMFWLFLWKRPHIIHTHLFDATLLGLFAGWLAAIPKRIHTRHHATQHHTYFPRAVRYDRVINWLSTHIVATSHNVERILMEREQVPPGKLFIIHHGFKFEEFDEVSGSQVADLIERHQISTKGPIIGCIARYTHLKGLQFLIPAFGQIKEKYPTAHLVLANARGDYAKAIKELLKPFGRQDYTEIEFEADLPALYSIFDVFVHVPINDHCEAFGQTYVEALIAGVPSVFTLSGVAAEFIKDGHNAIVVPYENSAAIVRAVDTILSNPSKTSSLVRNGKKDVRHHFSLERMIGKLEKLYLS